MALDAKEYSLALLVAGMCGRDTYQMAAKRFCEDTLEKGSPLHTVAVMFSAPSRANESSTLYSLFSNDGTLIENWMRHLASIINNRIPGWEYAVESLGDRLCEVKSYEAAHFCYMVCGTPIASPVQRKSRWTLVGCNVAPADVMLQTANLLNAKPIETSVYPRQIAFNCLPHIDTFQDNGYTKEEMKMVWETQKIMGDPDILVNPTCVRVPVFYGHSEAVHIETREPLGADAARELLAAAPGVVVMDERQDGGYPTAVTEASGTDPVFVGRIRDDISHPRGLDMWVVADNVRKGAALNSVQIAEMLVKSYL